jgi:hypothetical protein
MNEGEEEIEDTESKKSKGKAKSGKSKGKAPASQPVEGFVSLPTSVFVMKCSPSDYSF